MANFKISGRMSVANVKKQFKDEFKVTLRFLDAADDKATLASLQAQGAKRLDDMKIMGNTLVRSIKTILKRDYGISIDVAKEDNSELLHPDITLRQAAVGKFEPVQKKPKAEKTKAGAEQFETDLVMTTKDPEEIKIEFCIYDCDWDNNVTLHVNWGDGSPSEKYIVDELENIIKKYDKKGEFTITIGLVGYVDFELVQCSNNNLTSINASNFEVMKQLNCSNNKLTSMILPEGCLEALDCSYNELPELVSINNDFDSREGLDCSNNKIKSITLKGHYCLHNVNCSNNELEADALDGLFKDLSGLGGYINVKDNPGDADCDPSIAEDEGWEFEW